MWPRISRAWASTAPPAWVSFRPPADALEERGVRVALEQPDLDRHRRRGEVQLLGRAGEREVARGALEHPQLAQGRVLH